ncbi:ABC transporter substrate-binding protein [Leucobacter denitrificans]|uniref:Extracellular solute-binding protein n=1 Tax=Leucobacter denitrificans TaxID=683042 RepID=A0A7G9S2M0_9MICO|nr:extracellular solute-binding protein [Leucobacter denitrificans]QNN62095.1 extracellular solute-binding protein [Leucobacter denitrificans]
MKKKFIGVLGLTASAALVLTGCSSTSQAAEGDWTAAPVMENLQAQADPFTTYALPDEWANYGALFEDFCEINDLTCSHVDSDMSSGEAIQRYAAEKGNPIGYLSDIGGLWGQVAEGAGVTAPYVPEGAEDLLPGQYGENGGWINTFTGVVGFLVNDSVSEAPQTWDDLLKPEYANGKVASSGLNEPIGGTQQAVDLSIALARGGDVTDTDATWEYLNELFATTNVSDVSPSIDALIRGEYGVMVQYDFNAIAAIEQAEAQGVSLSFVVPSDGSIYMPSSILANGHNSESMDFIKAFMDYVLTDEAQLKFADFGARPIRFVNGDLEVPEERRARWLPEENYANTQTFDASLIDPEQLLADYNANVKN